MRSAGIRLTGLAAAATLGISGAAAGASAPGSTEHGVNRARLAAKAQRVVEARNGIEVLRISRCGPRRRHGRLDFSRWVCEWRAAGAYPGDVPYACAGTATWKRRRDRWRVERCRNSRQPEVALLATPNPPPTFGYNDDWIFQSNAALDLLDQGGGQVARTGLAWSGVERQPGAYDWYGSDVLYAKLLERGSRPLWTVLDAPCWAQPDPGACERGDNQHHPAPQHYDEFARFAAAAAVRYPEAIAIEIWNEPNYPRFWGGWPDPDAYAKLLSTAAAAIHEAAPAISVVSGGLSPHADSDRRAIGFSSFLNRLYEQGAIQRADAIGIHPYPGVGPNEDYVGDVRVYLGKVQNVIALHDDSDRPLWATEFGVSTAGEHAFDPGLQATALIELYELLRRVQGMSIPVAVVHSLVDPSLGGREGGFGVVRQSLEPKPAYCALSAVRGASPPSC